MLEEAAEAHAAMRIRGLQSWTIAFLAEGYLVLGRVAEAREQAEQAVALAHAQQEQLGEAWGLKVLGDIHARVPADVEHAAIAYGQALAPATDLGLRPLVAHCHLGLGELYRQTNKLEQAREHFTTAIGMYRDMDMRFWLQRAEVALNKRGVRSIAAP